MGKQNLKVNPSYLLAGLSFLRELSDVQHFADKVDPDNEFLGLASRLRINNNKDVSIFTEVTNNSLLSLRSLCTL